MSALLGDFAIAEIELVIPIYGVASASVVIDGPGELDGEALLTLGDLELSGVVTGDIAGSVGRYKWFAGAGLWETMIDAKSYESAVGVQLHNVLQDLVIAIANATGGPSETLKIDVPDNRLGPIQSAWIRGEGPASDTLRQLALPWYVRDDGTTVVGARQGVVADVSEARLLGWQPEEHRRTYVPEGDTYAPFLPGNTIDGEVIRETRICSTGGLVEVVVLTAPAGLPSARAAASLDRAVMRRTAPMRYFGRYEFRVASQSGTVFALEPAPVGPGLMKLAPLRDVEARYGVPGFAADLPRGTSVDVAFEAGDPARPYIVAFHAQHRGKPDAIDIQADDEIVIDASTVNLGDASRLVARETDPVTGITVSVVTAPGPPPQSVTMTLTDANGVTVALTFPALAAVVAAPPSAILTDYRVGTPGQSKVFA